MKDPYVVLGISKTATQDEIRKAYHNLAKKFHPDLNPGNKDAEIKFKDVSLAYERIGSEEERAKYDRGETPEQQQKQPDEQARERTFRRRRGPFYHETQDDGGRYSYSFAKDMGEDFFKSFFHTDDRSRYQNEKSSTDEYYQMSVDFKDAVLGAEREITFPNGKRLQVKIPPGIESGTKLRFKNQGGAGIGDLPPGDAYIEITVRPLARFNRVGNNIETEVAVSFIEALLGAEIKIPTIDGSVMLKIPSGVSTGSRLRVRGKGVAFGSSSKENGDQIVIIKVVLPKKIDPELEKTVREWGGKFSYNPREEP
ncbi:MAG: J domain-containing protein [Oligoflexia bacterium]|nr:J domain-containing protein [Oligoflexia bacterium]